MGFYLRKSVSVGPFRFSLSGSGISVSVGTRGFRIGSGRRGNYVHLGAGGVYYRHTFSDGKSADAGAVVDSSSEELLDEIRGQSR